MNGLATRQQLHAINAAADEDAVYEFRHGRASNKIHVDVFDLPRHPFMPNWTALGTPGEEKRKQDAAQARERVYEKAFWIGMAISAALIAVLALRAWDRANQPAPIDTAMDYQWKAKMLAPGGLRIAQDLHERCPVLMHKDHHGGTVVSTHC